ncbi:hypothetical protein MSPGM_30520 [Methylorubrum sp. GM97]|nr:hypothetical protein MSPGM_30520 [Methylorubrum sp. GM97]
MSRSGSQRNRDQLGLTSRGCDQTPERDKETLTCGSPAFPAFRNRRLTPSIAGRCAVRAPRGCNRTCMRSAGAASSCRNRPPRARGGHGIARHDRVGRAGSGGSAGERQGGEELQAAHAEPRNASVRRDDPAAKPDMTLRIRMPADKLPRSDARPDRADCAGPVAPPQQRPARFIQPRRSRHQPGSALRDTRRPSATARRCGACGRRCRRSGGRYGPPAGCAARSRRARCGHSRPRARQSRSPAPRRHPTFPEAA